MNAAAKLECDTPASRAISATVFSSSSSARRPVIVIGSRSDTEEMNRGRGGACAREKARSLSLHGLASGCAPFFGRQLQLRQGQFQDLLRVQGRGDAESVIESHGTPWPAEAVHPRVSAFHPPAARLLTTALLRRRGRGTTRTNVQVEEEVGLPGKGSGAVFAAERGARPGFIGTAEKQLPVKLLMSPRRSARCLLRCAISTRRRRPGHSICRCVIWPGATPRTAAGPSRPDGRGVPAFRP
ncbi:50S ribosomal protein L2 [Stigmatella aurantiaca DW4/3-1]|uniref:50S ribosomal protein L2 n=1 Tax=Stigmatella aurantiaca (strain DW4/3-1) TaxID=378806 RepID=E3FWU5_STIAD|nr:50S ribosomal protein L2 [Stigmatella aurantiaca DW4/3-1]